MKAVIQLTMWENVSRFWGELKSLDEGQIEQIAGRLAVTLVHDQFSSPTGDAASGTVHEAKFHHAEAFLFNTPRTFLAPGDMIEVSDGEDEFLGLVLTPACDLVPRGSKAAKAKVVLLARCTPLAEWVAGNSEAKQAVETALKPKPVGSNKRKSWDRANDKVQRMMRHAMWNDDGRLFFLPPFATFTGCVADFSVLEVRPYDSLTWREDLGNRRLSLTRDFTAELVTRFARYLNRVGQPAYLAAPIIAAVRRTSDEEPSTEDDS